MKRGTVAMVSSNGRFGFFTLDDGQNIHFRTDHGEQRQVLAGSRRGFFLAAPEEVRVMVGDQVVCLVAPDTNHAYLWGRVEAIPVEVAIRGLTNPAFAVMV